jgi:hypothetical protein
MGGRGALFVVAVALWSAMIPASLGAAGDEPTASKKRLLVIAGGKAASAQPGSYCLRSGGSTPGSPGMTECSSVSYDPTPPRLFRVSAGSTIAMCASTTASKMTVAVISDSKRGPRQLSSRRARRLDKSGECWRARLPRRMATATSLDIRVDYNRTDFTRFLAGITVRRR